MERTVVLVKPDGVKRGLVNEILKRIERAGLTIGSMRTLKLDRRTVEDLYSKHKGKHFFEKMVEFMTSGEVVAMVVEGEDAINKMRELAGATIPMKAARGTIRGDFGTSDFENVVHTADSRESVEREMRLLFKGDENEGS